MRKTLFILLLIAVRCFAGVPITWDVKLGTSSSSSQTAAFEITAMNGETSDLMPRFFDRGRTMSIASNAFVRAYFREWGSTNAFVASSATGTVYTTARDTGRVKVPCVTTDYPATTNEFYVGVEKDGMIFRGWGKLTVQSSVGVSPTTNANPMVIYDWSQIDNINSGQAPWPLDSELTAVSNLTVIAQTGVNNNSATGAVNTANINTISNLLVGAYVPYSGSSSNLDMGAHTVTTDGIGMNTNYVETGSEPIGFVFWNSDKGTYTIICDDGTKLDVGAEFSPRIYVNQTGSTITNGTPVMFGGAVGASGKIKIIPAIADGTYPAEYFLGCATHDIENGAIGKITWLGGVTDNTTGSKYGETWTNGLPVYVSATTAGFLTQTPPEAPNFRISAGAVTTSHAVNGVISMRPTWRGRMQDASDVDGTPLITSGQFLVWDQENGYFDPDHNINDYATTSSLATNVFKVSDSQNTNIFLTVENGTGTFWTIYYRPYYICTNASDETELIGETWKFTEYDGTDYSYTNGTYGRLNFNVTGSSWQFSNVDLYSISGTSTDTVINLTGDLEGYTLDLIRYYIPETNVLSTIPNYATVTNLIQQHVSASNPHDIGLNTAYEKANFDGDENITPYSASTTRLGINAGYGAITLTNSIALGIGSGSFNGGTLENYLLMDVYDLDVDPYLTTIPTNDAVMIYNGKLSLGRGGALTNPAPNELRGEWNVKTPTADNRVANKGYVDDTFSATRIFATTNSSTYGTGYAFAETGPDSAGTIPFNNAVDGQYIATFFDFDATKEIRDGKYINHFHYDYTTRSNPLAEPYIKAELYWINLISGETNEIDVASQVDLVYNDGVKYGESELFVSDPVESTTNLIKMVRYKLYVNGGYNVSGNIYVGNGYQTYLEYPISAFQAVRQSDLIASKITYAPPPSTTATTVQDALDQQYSADNSQYVITVASGTATVDRANGAFQMVSLTAPTVLNVVLGSTTASSQISLEAITSVYPLTYSANATNIVYGLSDITATNTVLYEFISPYGTNVWQAFEIPKDF